MKNFLCNQSHCWSSKLKLIEVNPGNELQSISKFMGQLKKMKHHGPICNNFKTWGALRNLPQKIYRVFRPVDY